MLSLIILILGGCLLKRYADECDKDRDKKSEKEWNKDLLRFFGLFLLTITLAGFVWSL